MLDKKGYATAALFIIVAAVAVIFSSFSTNEQTSSYADSTKMYCWNCTKSDSSHYYVWASAEMASLLNQSGEKCNKISGITIKEECERMK